MNLKTAAAKLGVHYQTAYKWIRTGELVAVKVAGGYEVSDDAIEQFRRRRASLLAATSEGVVTRRRAALETADERARAIATLRAMIDRIEKDATAVWTTATRLCAELVHDSAALVLRDPVTQRPDVAAFHHADPERLLLVSAILGDGIRNGGVGFGSRALDTDEVVHVRHVSQLAVRQTVHPEYHQHLDEVGIYSVVAAPVHSAGRVVGVLSVLRDKPGDPLTEADRDFVVEVAECIGDAIDAAATCRVAWVLRRTLKEQLEHALSTANGSDPRGTILEVFRSVDADRSAALLEPSGVVMAATPRYAAAHATSPDALTGRSVESVLGDDERVEEAMQRQRVAGGELEFAERTRRISPDERGLRVFEASVRYPDGRLVAIVETAATT